jgi:hypothetical protein
LFTSFYKGGGHTELAHVLEHDAVVGGVEGAFQVRVHDVDVFVVYFCIFHHHHDGGEGVVDAALYAEPIILVAENAVGFRIFRAWIVYESKFEQIVCEGDGAVAVEESRVTFFME